MRISPIGNNFYNKPIKKPQVAFKSFCADANANSIIGYSMYLNNHPDFKIMKASSTRIFRELSSELAIARLINPDKKTQVKILGCSDGSEVWGHAIVFKEELGDKVKNIKIQAVDKAPYMIETAKTGCPVLSDIEKEYAERDSLSKKEKSPILYEGWDKCLTKTTRPKNFQEIVKKYPHMKYLEYDPVVNKRIGKGLDWYEVNKEGLPDVSFECGDMRDYLEPDKDADNVIYVLANSSAYVLQDDPSKFLNIFAKIKENNKNKNVYVVIGDTENRLLNHSNIKPNVTIAQNKIKEIIDILGFKNVYEVDLDNIGIQTSYNTARKIYHLEN